MSWLVLGISLCLGISNSSLNFGSLNCSLNFLTVSIRTSMCLLYGIIPLRLLPFRLFPFRLLSHFVYSHLVYFPISSIPISSTSIIIDNWSVGTEKTWCGGVDCVTGAGDVCKCAEPCPCW